MRLNHLGGNLYELSRYSSRQQQAETLFQQGCNAEAEGDITSAQTFYAQSANADSMCKEAWLNLGTIQYRRGGFKRAEYCYRQALAVDPGYHLARYNLASCLQDMKRFGEAKEEFEQILTDCPDYFDALFNLAHLHMYDFNDTPTALRLVNQCEKLQPQDRNLKALKRSLAQSHRDKGWQILAS